MSDINSICDALFGSIVVSANHQVERKVGPNLEPGELDTVVRFFKESPCDVGMFKILEILARFRYKKNYVSAFGGTPLYISDADVANQAIDFVLSELKYYR